MAITKKAKVAEAPKTDTVRRFIGKSWVNKINKPGNKYDGVKYLTITKDMGVKIIIETADEVIEMADQDRMILFPNAKRAGKKDADFRLSVVSNAGTNNQNLPDDPF